MSKNYEQCLGIYKKILIMPIKHILCPLPPLPPCSINHQWRQPGTRGHVITYVQDRSHFFFFTGGCDPTRRRTKQGQRYKYLGGKLGFLAETALRAFCKTLISLFLTSKLIFLCQRDNFILQFLSIWESVFFSRACWSSWSSNSVPGLWRKGGCERTRLTPLPTGLIYSGTSI